MPPEIKSKKNLSTRIYRGFRYGNIVRCFDGYGNRVRYQIHYRDNFSELCKKSPIAKIALILNACFTITVH